MRDLVDELLQAKVKAQLFGGDHAPRLGRLILRERIGSGAMGDVFSAHDPRLDRDVAIKLVRPTADVPADRVLAEARALAKLAHPNVVAIYDAELVDADDPTGAIAIVMELARGIPLRAWLATDRDWRDVARVLRDAATGLAAAHAAGLVHRDIKPDNILVGDDRTRVVDFGLALTSASDEATSGAGTPTYMAPEVLGGAPATPAADQFSFGVTLFEALHGVRPHTGTSREELRTAALTAASAKPPRTSKSGSPTRPVARAEDVDALGATATSASGADEAPRETVPTIVPIPQTERRPPAWLHAIAARALAGDPRDRFASMAELAAALGRDRRQRRLLVIAIGAGLAIAAVVGVVAYRARGGSDPCAGADARIAGVWSTARASEVRARLGDAPWVPTALSALDDRRARWATSYRAVCEATRVRGDQSDSLLDLRMRCLDRALDRFDALATGLAAPLDTAARVEATSAVAELPSAEACETLVDAGELALPDDPPSRKRALAARHDIARVWAAVSLGRYRDAQKLGEEIETSIAGLQAPGVIAELATVRAMIEGRIGTAATAKPALDRALVAASTANAPELELTVWALRLRQELFAGDPARIEELLPLARAAAARAHRDGAELDGIAGEAYRDAKRLDDARTHLERALASKDPLRPDQRAVITMNLGAVHLAAGDLDKTEPAHTRELDTAEATLTRAYDLAHGALGDGHPTLALYLDKLAAVDRARNKLPEALARNAESLSLRVAAYGANDRSVATSLLGRARTYLAMTDLASATKDGLRAREIRAQVFGETSPRLGEIELLLGEIETAAGHADAAKAHVDRAHELDPRLRD